jgi:redox-sensitive bicupin YhaK (pirin superfamily)
MTIERHIARTVVTPPPEPGFIGEGHTAVEVVYSEDLPASDPFVLLMDDRLDIAKRRAIGGAHPHAGLETVTLILEGTIADRDEGELSAGDAIWMTAGRGIIHNEHVEVGGRVRILQLWIRLPAADRTLAPRFEIIPGRSVPVRREPGAVARLYSGSTGDLRSPTKNRAPITLVDLEIAPGATFVQDLPASYNGFIYVIDGAVTAGGVPLAATHVGWLDRPTASGASTLAFTAGPQGARLVLYTGEPQHEPLVHHGPFVAGSESEIRSLFQRFRAGGFESMGAIARRTKSDHAVGHLEGSAS